MGRPRLVALALAVVVALGGCGGESGSGAGGAGGGLSAVVEVKPAERKPAPSLAADLLDGTGRFDPSTVHGQVLVVNFWASWCAPCRAEAADLERVYQATKANGVAFLGINIQDGRDKALAFERGRTTYPSIFDPAGRVALGFKDVPPSTIPATLIIDRKGRVAVAVRTAVTKANLQPIVERIAAEGSDG